VKQNNFHITDGLLAKYLLGEATPDEKISVDMWLRADEANQLYFKNLRSIWEHTKQLHSVPDSDEEEAWKRFQLRIHSGSTKQFLADRTMWIRYAAVFILVAGISLIAYFFNSKQNEEIITAATTENVLKDTLSDGSVVTLNKHSSVTYPSRFKGDSRNIQLKGEAFFNVSLDKRKPFQIHVNDVTITVVGTSFNVRSTNGKTEVIVETGIVRVTRKNHTVELHPKEKVLVEMKDSVMKKENEEEHLYNYYTSHEFVCDATPLWKLVEVLNEAYQVNIIIERRELRTAPLTVTFSNESLDHILEVIGITLNAKVVRSGNEIILK
jgi:transmembrane sensor